MLRRRHRTEQGQVVVLVALVTVFLLGGVTAFVADLLAMENESARASTAAFLAAAAGSQAIDVTTVAGPLTGSGGIRLAPRARTLCESAGQVADQGATVTCMVTGGRVQVTVSRTVQLPVGWFGTTTLISSHAEGGPAVGTVHAS